MSELELLSLVRRVRLEYEEMPGLALTIPQAARLWRLEADVVENVMAALVDAEFLCRGRSGFIRRSPEQRDPQWGRGAEGRTLAKA
jgi:hypothetical protein